MSVYLLPLRALILGQLRTLGTQVGYQIGIFTCALKKKKNFINVIDTDDKSYQ